MSVAERSFSEVLRDVVSNIQDIVRSEVRLAKTELREDFVRFRSAALLLSIAALAGITGVLFVLLAAVYALSNVVPDWAAALIVGVLSALCAAMAVAKGLKQLKRGVGAPRTVESLKENVEWAKRQIK